MGCGIVFFRKRWQEVKRLFQMNKALSDSFQNVRRDTGLMFRWLQYLYHQNQQQQQVLQDLQNKFASISHVPQFSRREIQAMVEEHYAQRNPEQSNEVIKQRIAALESRLAVLQERKQEIIQPQNEQISLVLEKISDIGKRLAHLKEKSPSEIQTERPTYLMNLKEKVMKKIVRNSKLHIKQVIMNLLEKYDQASGLQLREMVVEEQRLCSESSFYRMLEELEDEGKLKVIQQGKEKTYMAISIVEKRGV